MRRIQGVNVNQHICYYISDSPEGSTAHAVACLGFSNQAEAIVREIFLSRLQNGKASLYLACNSGPIGAVRRKDYQLQVK